MSMDSGSGLRVAKVGFFAGRPCPDPRSGGRHERRHDRVALEERHVLSEGILQLPQRGSHRVVVAPQVRSLGRTHGFDAEHLLGVLQDAPHLQGPVGAHADVILLPVAAVGIVRA